MTPALRSRLEAERMFTVADLRRVARIAYIAGGACSKKTTDDLIAMAARYAEMIESGYLDIVQAHLSSDTTRIRPKRQA